MYELIPLQRDTKDFIILDLKRRLNAYEDMYNKSIETALKYFCELEELKMYLVSEVDKAACLRILNLNLTKGSKIQVNLNDNNEITGNFVRFVYHGIVLKNKGEYSRIKIRDINSVSFL